MSNTKSVIIVGDISPTRSYQSEFIASDLVDTQIRALLTNSYSVANLESPLTLSCDSISKTGPSLRGNPSCAKALANLGVKAVTLANNHIMDFGCSGLTDTISSCNDQAVSTFGAGISLTEASRPHIVKTNNNRILFFGLAESEFSIATENSAGAFPSSPIDFIDLIQAYKSTSDRVVILLHMGKAMYPLPSPQLQKLSRFMIRNGADVVVCQHSHCIAAYERYKEGLIFYGQGNFIFDGVSSAPESWYTGYLIKLVFSNIGRIDFELFPFRQSRERPYVKMIAGQEKNIILDRLVSLEKHLKDKGFIQSSWDSFVIQEKDYYMSILSGHDRILRIANRYLHFLNLKYTKTARRYLLNILRSETHRESIITLFNR